ncbi:hypothetical protein, partial [Anaerotignum sp.]|uniref:hypothetical protein n=1 Tax=Anaerotignum sp. TaxID=2039241 RepID=UPI00289E6FF7
LNYLVSQISSYLSSVYNNCLKIGTTTDTGGSTSAGTVMAKENAILAEVNKIGSTTDAGATETVGTVFAKLNKIISAQKFRAYKLLSTIIGANLTSYVVLSVTGTGEFYGVYTRATKVQVFIDGIVFNMSSDGSAYLGYKPSIAYSGNLIKVANASSTEMIIDAAVPFKNSLLVKIDTGTVSTYVDVSYSLYE